MISGRKAVVLAAYKPFLHILTIYDAKNFQNQNRRTLARNICQCVIVSMLCIASIVAILCDIWYCFIGNRFDVAKMALPFGIIVNVMQLVITYASIGSQNRLVYEVIDGLEEIITNR